MRITGSTIVLLALLVPGFAGPALAQVGAVHEDEQLGYQVRTPKDWATMPISTDERWMVAKFLSEREYADKEEGYLFKPSMTVIVFPFSVTKDRGVETKESEEGVTITIKNPYKDYKDYLKQTYTGGGWYIDVEKEMKNKDVEWTFWEIKVEKLAYGGKKRLVAGIFHADDADFVVQFEILEQNAEKHRNLILGCLRTFQFIPRKGSLAPATTGDIKIVDEDKMTPKERAEHREEKQRVAFRNSVERLPDGWTSFEADGFLVVTHVDKKYSMKIVKQAAAVRNWLDKNFPYWGDDYLRPPIIRICDSSDEERSYRGTGFFFSASQEIVTHKDVNSGAGSFELEWVNRGVMRSWFADRNRELYMAMPSWIEHGLVQYVGTARLKGARLQFQPDQWELEHLRNAEKADELSSVKNLLTLTGGDFWQKRHHKPQAAALLRFMIDGKGKGLTKTFLEDYFTALQKYVNEKSKESEKEKAPKEGPKTEEEEGEEFKRRQQMWREMEEELLKSVFERAFGGWKEATWKKLEMSYLQAIT